MKYQIRLIWKSTILIFIFFLSACSSSPTYTLEEQVWVGTTVINGQFNEYADAITVAPSGSIYVAGHDENATLFLTRLNGSGLKLWTRYFGGDSSRIEKIVADALGNSFILTRRTIFQVNIEPGQFIFDLYKYSSNGTQLWQKTIATISSSDISVAYANVSALEFDANGTLFIPILVDDVTSAGPLPAHIYYGLLATYDSNGNELSNYKWVNTHLGQVRKLIDVRVRQQAGVAGEWLLLEQFGFNSVLERLSVDGNFLSEQSYGGVPLKIASVTTEPFAIFMTNIYYAYTCIATPTCQVTFAQFLDNSVINSSKNEVAIIRRDSSQKLHGERYRITGPSITKVTTYPEPVLFALDKLALNKNGAIFSAGYFWNGQNADVQVRKFNARGIQY